jgi:hypothetical protein
MLWQNSHFSLSCHKNSFVCTHSFCIVICVHSFTWPSVVGARVNDEPYRCARSSVVLADKRKGEATKNYPPEWMM